MCEVRQTLHSDLQPSAAPGTPITTFISSTTSGTYTWTINPFVSTFQGGTSTGNYVAWTATTADATCPSGLRYTTQSYTGGVSCGGTIGGRASVVAYSCSTDGA